MAYVVAFPGMPYATLRYEVSDAGVATIALDQPETRNALSDELLDELIAAFSEARDDPGVRCVVLTSTHERIFSAGANLAGFAAEVPLAHKHFGTERFPRLFRLIGELGKPTICAANGHVLAGALGIALACDLILAREGARFGTPEINVGVFPFMIMALIYRNVPRKKTNELLLLGEQISAAEAERIGIVNKVFAPEEFEAGVREWAEKLAGKSPRADAARQGRDVPPAGHGVPRRARLPALPADDRLLDRGHPGGRARVLREARARSGRDAEASMPEARLEQTEYGRTAADEGWFVVNVRDAAWMTNEYFGEACVFEGHAVRFPQVGYTIHVLRPGQPNGLYHHERDQEDFLVLAGECIAILEGVERRMRAWDFLHCPPGTEHIFVGAGEGPCVIFMAGARARRGSDCLHPLRGGAGARRRRRERARPHPASPYGPFPEWRPGRPASFDGLPFG